MPQNKLDIPIFYGTYADLTKLDLSFINGTIVLYKEKKFKDCLRLLIAPENLSYSYNHITSDIEHHTVYENDKIRRYAIVPTDISQPFTEENWFHFYQLMLSIYPSDFTLLEIIHLHLFEEKYQNGGKSFHSFKSTGEKYFDNYMFIGRAEYPFVRKYLQKYFHSSFQLKYLKYILSVYSNSFSETNPTYQYISLVICLEVIVEGKEQLTYKLRRNTALLCGNTMESCKRIYDNVNQLYKLRSAIVHGEIKPSYKHFKEYHEYLKKLVARLIRELIVHNIPTIQELNEKITALGYGQNNLISKNYIASKYPLLDNIDLSYQAIQKY